MLSGPRCKNVNISGSYNPSTLITNYTPNDILSLTLIYCFLYYSSKQWCVSSCSGEACLWDVGRKYQSFYFCLFINKTTPKLALVIFNKDATDPFPIGMSSVNKTGDLYTWKKMGGGNRKCSFSCFDCVAKYCGVELLTA